MSTVKITTGKITTEIHRISGDMNVGDFVLHKASDTF
jgi:hypothetical protein